MWDHSSLKEGESDIAQGVWSYDAATKRYKLTPKGETTTYTLLSRGDPVTCILYKGHLDSADLRASWFSFPTRPQSAKYSPLMYWRHAFRRPPSRAWFKPSASDV